MKRLEERSEYISKMLDMFSKIILGLGILAAVLSLAFTVWVVSQDKADVITISNTALENVTVNSTTLNKDNIDTAQIDKSTLNTASVISGMFVSLYVFLVAAFFSAILYALSVITEAVSKSAYFERIQASDGRRTNPRLD